MCHLLSPSFTIVVGTVLDYLVAYMWKVSGITEINLYPTKTNKMLESMPMSSPSPLSTSMSPLKWKSYPKDWYEISCSLKSNNYSDTRRIQPSWAHGYDQHRRECACVASCGEQAGDWSWHSAIIDARWWGFYKRSFYEGDGCGMAPVVPVQLLQAGLFTKQSRHVAFWRVRHHKYKCGCIVRRLITKSIIHVKYLLDLHI